MTAPTTDLSPDQINSQFSELREALATELAQNELLQESIADLERRMLDPGWQRTVALAEQEFSLDGLRQIRAACRVYAIKHPLIKRALGLQTAYVWGRGVEISARSAGKDPGQQDVQSVVAAFLEDEGNQAAVTGHDARQRLQWALGTEGNVFIACFTTPQTGAVRVRTLPVDEIVEVITNPDDRAEPWFYRRRWSSREYRGDGTIVAVARELLYPSIDYRPRGRPRSFGGVAVEWSAPVMHVAVNRPDGWALGVPDCYAALDWARAYKEFLEDWARLMRALSRYAYKATAPGNKAGAVKARLGRAPARDGADPAVAGATVVVPPDVALEAVNKSGATIDSDSGRPLAMMVGSSMHIPVTMLLDDPGQTGSRATAQSLDQPTELPMDNIRRLWEGALRRICRHVITESVRAAKGALQGTISRDPIYDTETVDLGDATSTEVDFVWPSLDNVNPVALVEAVVRASGVGVVPPDIILRHLLTALGVRNVDSIVDAMVDEDGNFQWPAAPPLEGSQATAAARSGGDPANAGSGRMVADDLPEPPGDDDPYGNQLVDDSDQVPTA